VTGPKLMFAMIDEADEQARRSADVPMIARANATG
jgi:hypothetical protein